MTPLDLPVDILHRWWQKTLKPRIGGALPN